MDEALIRVEVLTPLATREGRMEAGEVVRLVAAEAALLASVGAVRLMPEAAPSDAESGESAPKEGANASARAPRKPRA